jgi:hypothetical protein
VKQLTAILTKTTQTVKPNSLLKLRTGTSGPTDRNVFGVDHNKALRGYGSVESYPGWQPIWPQIGGFTDEPSKVWRLRIQRFLTIETIEGNCSTFGRTTLSLSAFLGMLPNTAIAPAGIIVVIGTLSHQDGDHFQSPIGACSIQCYLQLLLGSSVFIGRRSARIIFS